MSVKRDRELAELPLQMEGETSDGTGDALMAAYNEHQDNMHPERVLRYIEFVEVFDKWRVATLRERRQIEQELMEARRRLGEEKP